MTLPEPSLQTQGAQTENPALVRVFWGAMLIILILGCAKHYLTFATGPTQLENDALEYWERGGRVAEGDFLQIREAVNYRGPLYSWFIGWCRWTTPENGLQHLSILQALLSLLVEMVTAWMCWDVTRKRWCALMGYAMQTASVTSPWYANLVLTEILFQFVFTCCVWMLVRYHRNPHSRSAVAFGALLSLSTLVRPVPKLLWIPLMGLFFCHRSTKLTAHPMRTHRIAWHLMCCALPMLFVLLPWSIRNYMFFDDGSVASLPPINKWVVCFHGKSGGDLEVPTTAAGNTLRVFLPKIDDASLRQDGYEVIRQLQNSGLSDKAIDHLISEVCWDAILANPTKFGWQTFKRFGNYWRCTVRPYPYYSTYPLDGNDSWAFGGNASWRNNAVADWYEIVLRNSLFSNLRFTELYSFICWLGLIHLFRRVETRIIALSLGSIFLYFAGVTAALEIENYRYRMVLEPTITLVIACALCDGLSFVCVPYKTRLKGSVHKKLDAAH